MKNEIIQAQSYLQNSPAQPDKAISILKKHKNFQGAGAWIVFYLLGIAYMLKSEYKFAVKSLEGARKKGGENLDVLQLLSESYIHLKKYHKAELIIARILSQKEDHAKAWKNLGLIYQAQEKYEEALRVLGKANSFDSSDLSIAALAGQVNIKNGKLDEAWRAFESILKVNTYYMDAHLGKANICFALKKYEDALDCLKTAEQIDPENKKVKRLQGEIFLKINEEHKAKVLLERLLSEDSNDYESRMLLGKCYVRLNEFDEAETEFLKALTDGANPSLCIPLYGESIFRNSKYTVQKRYQILKKTVKEFPDEDILTYVPEINRSDEKRPLNIGFISDALWDTPIGEKYLSIVRHLPKDQVKIFAYASNRENDPVSRKISNYCESFSFIFKSSPVETRETILRHQIDILIDCTTDYVESIHRVIQRKPAPVILKWADSATNPLEFKNIDFLLVSDTNKDAEDLNPDLNHVFLPEMDDLSSPERLAAHLSEAFNQIWVQITGTTKEQKRKKSKMQDITIEPASQDEIDHIQTVNSTESVEVEDPNKLIPNSFWGGLFTGERAKNAVETTCKFFSDDFTSDLLNQIVEETTGRLENSPTDNLAFFVQARALQALQTENALKQSGFTELDEHLKQKSWWFKRAIYSYWFKNVEWKKTDFGTKVSAIIIANKFKERSVENLKKLSQQLKGIGEIVFVNNGLNDSEFEVLMPYITIFVKTNGNSGAYLARNLGAIFSRGEYLIFVDDDGIPDDNFISAHLEEHATRDIIVSRGMYYSSNIIDDPYHYNIGTKVKPAFTILEGNAMYKAEAFFKVGGWGDYILFGHGGKDLSYRLLEFYPDKEQQIYVPASRLQHEYFRGESHKSVKIEKQTVSMRLLEELHPGINEVIDSWPSEFSGKIKSNSEEVAPALLILPSNKKSKFIHVCRNHVYAQSVSDMVEEINKTSDQQHWFLVEKTRWSVGGEGYTIDENKNSGTLFFDCTSKSDIDGIIRELTHPEVSAVFFHGIFRQWEFYLLNAIGDKQHVGWIIWGGDLYKPIQRNQDRIFPHAKFSSVLTSAHGDIELFKKYYGEKEFFDFAYPYPALYGDIAVPKPIRSKKIIVGNSGDPSNNHVEILKQLSRKEDINDYQLILPVAYNFNADYKAQVVSAATELGLTGNVKFHDSFISPEEYRTLISEVDMMIMAHERQQAMGNTLMGLYFNKPVFLKQNISLKGDSFVNPGWKFLQDHGLKPMAFEDFESYATLGEITSLTDEVSTRNRDAIEEQFGLKARSELLEKVSNQIYDGKKQSILV